MSGHRAEIILACVGLYMAFCLGVGVWAMRRTRSSAEFFAAGRSLGFLVTAAAVFSSIISGFAFVGGPGLVYRMGTSSIWICVTGFVAGTLSVALVGKRVRVIAGVRDTYSLPDVLAVRYGSELTRFLAAVAILVGVVGYLATQIKAMATVLASLVGASGLLGPMSLGTAAVISSAVLVFYCTTGGVVASVYTDVVQGAVMVVAGALVFVTAWTGFDGGFAGMSAVVAADDPEAMGPWGTLGMMGCLSWFLLFALGASGQPHVVTKYMMFERMGDLRRILVFMLVGTTLSAFLWFAIGLFMRASVLSGAYPALAEADDAAPVFLQVFAHPLLAGLVFAALFAAIMSTADAFLSIGAAALVHDVPVAILGRPIGAELLWARITTVILTALATVFAVTTSDLIALLGAASWGVFASALVPAVAIGLNWKRATPLAANVSIVLALVANVGARLLDLRLPHGVDPAAMSLVVSVLVFLSISLASRPRELGREVEALLEL